MSSFSLIPYQVQYAVKYYRIYLRGVNSVPESDEAKIWNSYYNSQPMGWRGESSLPIEIPPRSRVLDVGCGNGKTLISLTGKGLRLNGIDISSTAVQRCRGRLGKEAEIIVGDMRNMPYENASFEFVLAVHSLNHLSTPCRKEAADEIARLLAAGGTVFIRSFDKDDMRCGLGHETEPMTFMRGNGVMYHFFTVDEIKELFPSLRLLDAKQHQSIKRYHCSERRRSWLDVTLASF